MALMKTCLKKKFKKRSFNGKEILKFYLMDKLTKKRSRSFN